MQYYNLLVEDIKRKCFPNPRLLPLIKNNDWLIHLRFTYDTQELLNHVSLTACVVILRKYLIL